MGNKHRLVPMVDEVLEDEDVPEDGTEILNSMYDLFDAVDPDEESDESKDGKEDFSSAVTISFTNPRTGQPELFRVLLDSGTSGGMATSSAVKRACLHMKPGQRRRFNTAAGPVTSMHTVRVPTHSILGLYSRRKLSPHRVSVVPELGPYDFIFGRKYMRKYGMELDFKDDVIRWDGMTLPMSKILNPTVPKQSTAGAQFVSDGETDVGPYFCEPVQLGLHRSISHCFNSRSTEIPEDELDGFAAQILDSKYEEQNLSQVAHDQTHLTEKQRGQLETLLTQHQDLFNGKLGLWPDGPVTAEIKSDSQPYHCQRAMRIPHVHIETVKKEVQRLVDIGVLEPISGTQSGPWCAPSFIIAKKDHRVRFITDYRKLNRCIVRKPWPMPHIMDLIQDIGEYAYVTALDLSMGYYHFELDEKLKELSTFMLPWGLYRYKRLPMGLNISPDLFQEKISRLFSDLPYMKVFLDDLLIFSNGTYDDHLAKVQQALERLHSKNLAVNALKSYWAVKEVDYLGFRLTPKGILPQPRKVKAIMNMAEPKNKKELRGFIGLVNYYRHMWKHRSHLLAPLSSMAGAKAKFDWTDQCRQAFEAIKRMVAKEVMLSFPDYSQPFQLYTDASDRQLGAVLKQGDKVLAFFSKKLNPAQRRYGVGEKEMLSVVEALKEFRTMVLGYPIDVYVDHKNWTHDNSIRNSRVLSWRLALEEYILTFHFIQGEKNIIADQLSRLFISDLDSPTEESMLIHDAFCLEEDAFDMIEASWRKFYQPLTLAEIGRKQKDDADVRELRRLSPDRLGETFEDIGKKTGSDHVLTLLDPVDNKQRIIVPKELRQRLMNWYHTHLIHPGQNRLYNTLRQHYTWKNMQKNVQDFVKTCKVCQVSKRGLRGMGKLPLKDVEFEPWRDVAVDLAGPWKATIDNQEAVFWTLTIIDVFSGWVEIIPIQTKKAETIRDLFEREWLRRYPRPSRVIFDAGSEFDNVHFQGLLTLWHVKPEPITVKNPRANAIVETMHRTLGNMIRAQLYKLHPRDDPIYDLCAAAAYGIRSTVHGVNGFSPGQIVFGKDMLLRTQMEADIELIRARRQTAAERNNQRENRRRIAYDYKVGDKVLVLSGGLDPKLQLHQGPYTVLAFNKTNGTLHVKRRNYVEPINIRLVRPYFGASRGGD